MMAQATHRNQKMMRTPEDCTPRNRSYWINRVASNCAGRAREAGQYYTHLDLSLFFTTPCGKVFPEVPLSSSNSQVSSLLL